MSERRLDRIYIEELPVRCILGINPEERVNKQDVIINVTLHADLRRAAASDDIADTVDYERLRQRIVSHVEASQYLLVERLAERIAELCLEAPLVEQVRVRVDKPEALPPARSVAVEILRLMPPP